MISVLSSGNTIRRSEIGAPGGGGAEWHWRVLWVALSEGDSWDLPKFAAVNGVRGQGGVGVLLDALDFPVQKGNSR